MASIEEIVNSIDAQLQDLAREVAYLEDARAALIDGSAAPAPPAPRVRARAKTARRPASRKGGAVSADELFAAVVEHPGSSTPQLAALLGGDPARLLVLLREAETAGIVRRTGERRGTRWHPYTDEEKIAERAAQLERQRKPRVGGKS